MTEGNSCVVVVASAPSAGLLYYTRSKEYITLNFNKSTFASSTTLQTHALTSQLSRSILELRKGVFVRGVFVNDKIIVLYHFFDRVSSLQPNLL